MKSLLSVSLTVSKTVHIRVMDGNNNSGLRNIMLEVIIKNKLTMIALFSRWQVVPAENVFVIDLIVETYWDYMLLRVKK